MEKQKQNKALDTVTDKVQDREMKGDQAVGNLSASSQEKPKIKPSDADLKLFKAKFECSANMVVDAYQEANGDFEKTTKLLYRAF